MKKIISLTIIFLSISITSCKGKGNNDKDTCKKFHEEIMSLYNKNKIKAKMEKQELITVDEKNPFGSLFAKEGLACKVNFDFKFGKYESAYYHFYVYKSKRFAQDKIKEIKNKAKYYWDKYGSKDKIISNNNTVFTYMTHFSKKPKKQVKKVIEVAKKYIGVKK